MSVKVGFARYPGLTGKTMILRRYRNPLGPGYLIVSQEIRKDGEEISWPTPEKLKEALIEKRRMEVGGVK